MEPKLTGDLMASASVPDWMARNSEGSSFISALVPPPPLPGESKGEFFRTFVVEVEGEGV